MVLRILVIAILLYIGYRLILGEKKGGAKKDAEETHSGAGGPIEDVLVEDPVCHNLIPKGQAVAYEYKGNTLYFCSKACCDTFAKEKGEEK